MFDCLKQRIKRLFLPKVEVKDIVSFELCYTCGYFMNADCKYGLFLKDGEYTAYIKPVGKDDEDRSEYIVDKDFVLKLEAVLAKGGVSKWNGFNQSNRNILDGDNFWLHLNNGKGGS